MTFKPNILMNSMLEMSVFLFLLIFTSSFISFSPLYGSDTHVVFTLVILILRIILQNCMPRTERSDPNRPLALEIKCEMLNNLIYTEIDQPHLTLSELTTRQEFAILDLCFSY